MFALNWSKYALDRLADIYIAATLDEQARIAGVDALNARLRSDPLNEGESRSGGYRLTFTPLLSVGFYVSTADRVVQVTRVKRYGK